MSDRVSDSSDRARVSSGSGLVRFVVLGMVLMVWLQVQLPYAGIPGYPTDEFSSANLSGSYPNHKKDPKVGSIVLLYILE